MWRHPRTATAGYDWARPELYQHIARVCERGKFDMVIEEFVDLVVPELQRRGRYRLDYAGTTQRDHLMQER